MLITLKCILIFYQAFCVLDYIRQKIIVCGRMGRFQGASSSVDITKSHSELPVNVGVHSTDMQRTESAHL
jgi:hypothetical protein